MASVTYTYGFVGKQDNLEQMAWLDFLKDNCTNAFAMILHDKDEGVDPHIHFMFTSYKSVRSIQEQIGHNIFLELIQDKIAYAKYMLHQTEESQKDGKYQYSVDEMSFSSSKFQSELLLKSSEESVDSTDSAKKIFDLIYDDCIHTMSDFIYWVLQLGLYKEFKRSSYLWYNLFKETHPYIDIYEKEACAKHYKNHYLIPDDDGLKLLKEIEKESSNET